MQLFIVRHGQSVGQIDSAWNNHPDTALSPLGERQAEAVARRLTTLDVSHLISSPLVRALGTAAAIATATGRRIAVWPELCEGWTNGYQSFGRQELLSRFPQAELPERMTAAGWTHAGDDTYAALTARAEGALARLTTAFGPAARVVVVTHGGLANALLHALLHIPPTAPQWFELDNASLTQVRLVPDPAAERGGWPVIYPPVAAEVWSVNDTAHLQGVA